MERFNQKEDTEITALSIAKDIIYSDLPNEKKVKLIEKEINDYMAICDKITELQEKYDENGYDYTPILKLQRIEAHVDMTIEMLSKNCL